MLRTRAANLAVLLLLSALLPQMFVSSAVARSGATVASEPVEPVYSIDTARADSASIFDATVLWEGVRPVPVRDRIRQSVLQGLTRLLGGPPQQTRVANLAGSAWLLARRGQMEAAGLLDYFAYGTYTGGVPSLPAEGSVMSSSQFKALVAQVGKSQERRSVREVVQFVGIPLAVIAAALIVLVIVRRSARRRAGSGTGQPSGGRA